jgi:hypothetical protein
MRAEVLEGGFLNQFFCDSEHRSRRHRRLFKTHETKKTSGRHQMRIVLIVACAAALGFSAWANLPADAGQSAGAPTLTVTTAK